MKFKSGDKVRFKAIDGQQRELKLVVVCEPFAEDIRAAGFSSGEYLVCRWQDGKTFQTAIFHADELITDIN